MMALQFNKLDCITVLCSHYVDPKHRPFPTFKNPLEIAAEDKNTELVRTMLVASSQLKQYYLDLHKESLFTMLEDISDFQIDMKFEWKSSIIPFIGTFAPSETFRIYKRDSNIRVDLYNKGDKTKNSSNVSILFKGRDTKNPGELFVVNHNTQKITSIFNDWDDEKIKNTMAKAAKRKLKLKESLPDWVTISPYKDWLGTRVYSEIDGIPVQKYNIKCTFKVFETKCYVSNSKDMDNEYQMIDQQMFDSYDSYIAYLTDNNLFIGSNDNPTDGIENSNFYFLSGKPSKFIDENNGNPFSSDTEVFDKKINSINIKTVATKAWMSSYHKFTVREFMPLLKVLSYASNHLNKLDMFFSKMYIDENLFPVKVEIPLKLSLKAVVSLQNYKPKWLKRKAFFTVDEVIYSQFIKDNLNRADQFDYNNFVAPTNDALKQIYSRLKIKWNESEQSESDDDTERLNQLYTRMVQNRSESHSHNSSINSNQFMSRDQTERSDIAMIKFYNSSKIKTMNDVHKRSSKIIKNYGLNDYANSFANYKAKRKRDKANHRKKPSSSFHNRDLQKLESSKTIDLAKYSRNSRRETNQENIFDTYFTSKQPPQINESLTKPKLEVGNYENDYYDDTQR